LFGLQWAIFRGTLQPPEVDPFAAAIVAQVLTRLKELIAGRDANAIEIDVEKLPLGLARWPWKKAKLFEIAAAVGGQALRYLIEFRQLKAGDDCALAQAVAFGDPETIRMIWGRMDAEARVRSASVLVSSIVFHHPEVANWLVAEHPPWLGLARRVAREKRAIDVLSRLAQGVEELSEEEGLVKEHAKALEQLGVPLACCVQRCLSVNALGVFDDTFHGVGQSLLLVESDDGRTFGALIAIRWPKLGVTATDVRCRSFLFTMEGVEATRFRTAASPALFHGRHKICVGELTLDLSDQSLYWDPATHVHRWKHRYSCGTESTGGRCAPSSGTFGHWGIWAL
jgi:hypothetical protein